MEQKTFIQLRNETPNQFHKLFYEVVSRFHDYDYEFTLTQMSDDLKNIIEQCKKEIDGSERISTKNNHN